MPKIPLYNQGQGSQVRTATGPLSPRANVGAFTAPGQAQARFFEKAADVAYQFGMQEKQRETKRLIREQESLAKETSAEFLRNDKSTSAEQFKANFKTFADQQINTVNQLNVTNRQRQDIQNSISRVFSLQNVQGQSNAYLRGEEEAGKSYADTIEQNMEALRTLDPNDARYQLLMTQIESTIDEADATDRTKYLPTNVRTKDKVRGLVQTDSTTILIQDPSTTIEQLEQRKVQTAKAFADGLIDGVASRQIEGLLNGAINTKKRLEEIAGTDAEKAAYERAQIYQFDTLVKNDPTLGTVDQVIESIKNKEGDYAGINVNQQKYLLRDANSIRDTLLSAKNFQAEQDLEAGLIAVAQGANPNLVQGAINHYHNTEQTEKAEKASILLGAAVDAYGDFNANIFATPAQINESLVLANRELSEAAQAQDTDGILKAQKKVDLLSQLYQQRDKNIQQNPYGYVQSQLEKQGVNLQAMDAQAKASMMISYQKKLGVANVDMRVISQAEVDAFKQQYDATDSSMKGATLEQFFSQYQDPNMQRMLMRNLRQSGFDLIDNLIASDPYSPKNVLLDTAKNFKQEDLNKVISAADREAISIAMRDKMLPFTQSIAGGVGGNYFDRGGGGGRLAFTFEVEQSLIKVAQVAYYQNQDINQAVETAFEVIGRKYDFSEINNKTLRVPKSANLDASQITNFLDRKISDVDYLRSIVKPPIDPGQTEANSLILYTNRISGDGSWRTLDDDSGAYMVDGDGNFVMQEVVSTDEFGTEVMKEMPIIIKFSEISGTLQSEEETRIETLQDTPGGKGKLILEQQLNLGRADLIPTISSPPMTDSIQEKVELAKERLGKDG